MIVTLDAGFRAAVLLATMARSLSGTLVTIESGTPAKLMVRAEEQFQTFSVAPQAVVERESSFGDGTEAKVTRIEVSDLTPGEYVKLAIDAEGQVTHGRAVVRLQWAKVKSASGPDLVLEDGTKLTIGSILRFVTAEGKPSATATVQSGERVLLFRHPRTRNIYRVAAVANRKTPCSHRKTGDDTSDSLR